MKKCIALKSDFWAERKLISAKGIYEKMLVNRIEYKKGDILEIVNDYDVVDGNPGFYTVKTKEGNLTIIYKSDCKLIEEEQSSILITCL